MSGSRSAGSLLAALLLAACSSAAVDPPEEECIADADCPSGFLCAEDQGRCLPGTEAAPRAHLGFDIRERSAGELRFRVEVDGCDCMVRESQSIRELTLRRSRVSQQLLLSTNTSEDVDTPLTAGFELSQPSRFGRAASQLFAQHPAMPDDPEAPTVLRWPRYYPLDIDPPRELIVWALDPEGDMALRYLGIDPPRTIDGFSCTVDADCCEGAGCDPWPNFCDTSVGQCTAVGSPDWKYHYVYEPQCSRDFSGDVALFDPTASEEERFTPLPGANVRLRYGDPPEGRYGIPTFGQTAVADRPPECSDDSDCDTPDEYCDPDSQQCFLALAGRVTHRNANLSDDLNGTFRTKVYTYCDGLPNVSLRRQFQVTVTPPGPRPSVDYLVDAEILPHPTAFHVGNKFCIPDWGEGTQLEVAFSGVPRALISDEEGPLLECCDVSCLPTSADDFEDTPPSPVNSCDGRQGTGTTSLRFEGDYVLELADIVTWAEADCATPATDGQGRVGSLLRSGDCSIPGEPCRVEDLAVGTAEEPRTYRVRYESPVGSVFASRDFSFEIGPDTEPQQEITLSPRTLVTGYVDVDATICARRGSGEDCAAREAFVIAERLRIGTEEEPPGPYLHTVSTFYDPVQRRDGAFVLPLDPGGIYVVTALPPAGAEGGPGNFAVVDLREGQPEPGSLTLTLEDGVVVTLLLELFDSRASVVPVDRGSYLTDGKRLVHPARADTVDPFIDLNRIGECWAPAAEGPQGCKIRRLIPPGSDLARNLSGQVRFTARRSNQAECPAQPVCPEPLAEP